MKIQQREIRTIAIGVLVVLAVLVYKVTAGSRGRAVTASDTIGGALERVGRHNQIVQSMGRLTQELKVKIPEVSSGDQETQIREQIANQARQCGLQFASLRRIEVSARRGKTNPSVQPIQFRLDVTGPFKSLLQFVSSLEDSPIPYVVKEARIENYTQLPGGSAGGPPGGLAGGPRGGPVGRPGGGSAGSPPSGSTAGKARVKNPASPSPPSTPPPPPSDGAASRGNRNQPVGMVRATMKIQSYLFPEPEAIEKKTATGKTEESRPPTEGRPGRASRSADRATTLSESQQATTATMSTASTRSTSDTIPIRETNAHD